MKKTIVRMKMYKKGKMWVYASVLAIGTLGGSAIDVLSNDITGNNVVYASDTLNGNQNKQVSKEDREKSLSEFNEKVTSLVSYVNSIDSLPDSVKENKLNQLNKLMEDARNELASNSSETEKQAMFSDKQNQLNKIQEEIEVSKPKIEDNQQNTDEGLVTEKSRSANNQAISPRTATNTFLSIQRVDGLVVGSRELTFYIPKVDGQRIDSISVTNPDTGQTLYWYSNSIKVDDTGTLNKVTFTNPDNLKLVNDPKNVGKVFKFSVFSLDKDNKKTEGPAYNKPLDSDELMKAKQSAKEKINKLENLTFDQKQQYLNRVEESDTVSKID
ncbi:KxYKxGKxW signal peptide domain-containing protein, partial [Leuconostoc citreum]|uniref:KxYKxGKxW signal peptide domain-containing protein n=1 Tax=Leuconostoc citreum TaxID=33964 RepID=UPI0032DEF67D